MGISCMGSSSPWLPSTGNPNPHRFTIKDTYVIDELYCALKVNYPDCLNYEGNKVLVFNGYSLESIKSMKYLDPHFSRDKKSPTPFARFEPTAEGWEYAKKLVNRLAND